ncbi:N-acetylmannosamine-6-phosphate 2-epimerase [Barnesiella viscericola]|uniref:N-acylglucosamine-6-phosphate 2-epimerase n=1 Tax=Barnesiella viscericola TaxID=397865 RepID=A0A921STZ0_9BACT|nr:N-acetylmannosamine-6-phosphate 2-epimerase [Barnesiella viscericola]HJG88176.1 N-acetylmannosamine-6-phosphate 2-epimerase [Barnesiella viscericola]
MTVLEKIRNGLIVSCQAEEGSPFNTPKGVGDFARCAELGGAVGIRSCGVEKSLYIMQNTSLPVICLTKSTFDDGFVRITGSFAEVEALLNINATFIAVDGTNRLREKIYTGPDFIHKIKQMHPDILVMADIATPQEAVACYEAGADCVSTTLCGYTSDTISVNHKQPSFEVLQECIRLLPHGFPIMAEGRFNKPEYAAQAIEEGAWAVIVGTSITRPQIITQWYVDAIKQTVAQTH